MGDEEKLQKLREKNEAYKQAVKQAEKDLIAFKEVAAQIPKPAKRTLSNSDVFWIAFIAAMIGSMSSGRKDS